MSDKFHNELIAGHPVPDEQLVIHDRVWASADNFVLISSLGEPLSLANEEVDPGLHLLIVQKVNLEVRFLGGKDQAMVSV